MKIDNYSYNVVLLPNDDLAEEATRLSKLIAKNFPVEFILNKKNYNPHLTLYQLEMPSRNLTKAKKLLSNIFKEAIILKFDHYYGGKNGFISWGCQNSSDLYNLHKNVVNSLNYLRQQLPLPTKKIKYDLNDEDYPQIEQFGSAGLFENFRPHITITRLKKKNDYQKALKLLPHKKPQIVRFNIAAIGRLSIHGTLSEILEEFQLG